MFWMQVIICIGKIHFKVWIYNAHKNMLPGIFFVLLFPSFVEKRVTYPHDPLRQSASCLTTGKRHEQNSVPVHPTERHWHFLRSLQCRCVMCLSSCGVAGFWNNVASLDLSSLTVQPFPTGFQRSAFERWLWHHTADTILLKRFLKASSVRESHATDACGYHNASAHQGWCMDSVLFPFLSISYQRQCFFQTVG